MAPWFAKISIGGTRCKKLGQGSPKSALKQGQKCILDTSERKRGN